MIERFRPESLLLVLLVLHPREMTSRGPPLNAARFMPAGCFARGYSRGNK